MMTDVSCAWLERWPADAAAAVAAPDAALTMMICRGCCWPVDVVGAATVAPPVVAVQKILDASRLSASSLAVVSSQPMPRI